MIPSTVYLVVSSTSGMPLSVYTTREAADADVAAVNDGRAVQAWTLKDGYTVTVGKWSHGS